MPQRITRRKALATSAASAGLIAGTMASTAEALPLDNVWGEDFLMQWSKPDNVKRDLTPGPTHIRLSCAGYTLRSPKRANMSWGDQIARVRADGYTAVETYGHNFDYSITDAEIREIKDACRQHDVEFYTLHVWANIIHPDMQERARIHKIHAQAIEMAERFGMKFILTHTGGRSGENKDRPHPLNFTRETWEMSVAATKKIINDTSGSKIALAFEAVNSCNNNTPQSHVRLKEDVGDNRVKVTLDPTNMLHAGTFFRTTELINMCFDLIGEDIMYAHAKDKTWTDMMPHFEAATLGDGTMDFEQYLARMSHLKYPRCMLIEHLPSEQYPPSKKHLEDTAKKLGVKIYQ